MSQLCWHGGAARQRSRLLCFPECYVPGYRDAAQAQLTVILGTECSVQNSLCAAALVKNLDGRVADFQDKVQLDPSEDGLRPWHGTSYLASRPSHLRHRHLS